MSAKLRLALWVTFMVLLVSVMVLVFVLVINRHSLPEDPAAYLVDVVIDNANDVEFDRGTFEWDDLSVYKRGVYCSFYNTNGDLLLSANKEDMDFSGEPFVANRIRTVGSGGREFYLYDTYVDMEVSGLWIRGVTLTDSHQGITAIILRLTMVMLPARMFERLEKLFEAERQFTSDASHELRTPTSVILAECDHAKRKERTAEEYLESIGHIEEQGQRMSALIEELLGITRLQQGTEKYPLRKGDFSEFVGLTTEGFVPQDNRGIQLETFIEDGITCSFNASLISRAIYNLLQNAYKYGSENGYVRLSLGKDGEMAVLNVKDNGIGIAPEDQDKIWQRFWQADPSRGENGSSGLGLAMVKEIAELHGGSVSVESDPGKGSTFSLRIPLASS